MPLEENSRFIDEYTPIIDALIGKHALDVAFIDLRNVSEFADAFIIASARSDINARTLLEVVTEKLDEASTVYKVEGADSARWKLIDAGDAVIHIFNKAGREFYKLERLWGDAPTTKFENNE